MHYEESATHLAVVTALDDNLLVKTQTNQILTLSSHSTNVPSAHLRERSSFLGSAEMGRIPGFPFQWDSRQSSGVCVLNRWIMKPCVSGFLNLYKPKCCWNAMCSCLDALSSFCANAVKKSLCVSKIGHSGILDSYAEGVLFLAIGRSTRLIPVPYGAVVRTSIFLRPRRIYPPFALECSPPVLTVERECSVGATT